MRMIINNKIKLGVINMIEKLMKKEYLNLALPSGFECVVGVLITMTDTFMISQFGSGIIASVGAMGTVIDFMYLVLQSINVSNNVLVARLLGKNEEERNNIILKMSEQGIPTNVHYKPLPMMTAYKELGFDIKDFPNAYEMYKNEITLPLHTLLDDEQVNYIVKCFKEILGE